MPKVVVSLAVALGLCLTPLAAHAAPVELLIDSDFGPLTLVLDPELETAMAYYPKHQGRVVGIISNDGLSVTGYWLQPRADQRCPTLNLGTAYWGTVTFSYPFRPAPGDKLWGRWGYCDAPQANPWMGVFK